MVWLMLLSTACGLAPACGESGANPKAAVAALAFTPDQSAVVVGSQSGVVVQSISTKKRETIPASLDHIHALAFSPDGKTLAIAGGSPAEFGAVELWSWPNRKRLHVLKKHADVAYAIAWLGNDRLATASADRTIQLWNIAEKKQTHILKGHSGPVLALAMSGDGKWLCSGSADHTIRVWNPATGKLARTLTNHLGPVFTLAFQPTQDDRLPYLASGGDDNTVRVWQPSIGRLVRIIRHPAAVTAVAWNAKGTHLYTGDKAGALRTIDADSDEVLATREKLGRITALAVVRSQGRIGVASTDGRWRILHFSKQ